MTKAVLFDLDGTLVSTRPDYRYQVVGRTLSDLGRRADRCAVDAFWFGAERNAIIQAAFDVEPDLFWATYARHDLADVRATYTSVFGDLGALDKLQALGVKLGIVTNAPAHVARVELALVGMDRFASIVVANASHGIRPKPMPDGILACLQAMALGADEACFVGNAAEDLAAARAARVLSVHIERHEHPLSPEAVPPGHSITDLHALLALLEP